VALGLLLAHGQLASVSEELLGLVAGRARYLAVRREARLEKQPLAQRHRLGVAGYAVAGVARPRRGPRPVLQDGAHLGRCEIEEGGGGLLRAGYDSQRQRRHSDGYGVTDTA
jgi:hypothetical protein